MPSIHLQITPRHETTRVTYQEHRRTPVLRRLTQSAQHILRRPVRLALRELHKELLDHGGHDVSWRNGVDADVVHSPFRGEVAAELDNTGFGGVVGGAN
jgi:hypothetical protein